jgi:hypothetical protein
MADPVRDLNNFLQGQPGGNATRDFQWLLTRELEEPENDTVYHVTTVFPYQTMATVRLRALLARCHGRRCRPGFAETRILRFHI